MRFSRYGHCEFRDTPRKRAAFARKQLAEQQAFPLFAEEIAEQQHSVDEEMAARSLNWAKREREDRQQRAVKWREGRRRLAAYPEDERRQLLAYWQRCSWPGDPTYLLSMMHMYDNQRLDLHPVPFEQTEAQRQAVRDCIARIHSRNNPSLCTGEMQ